MGDQPMDATERFERALQERKNAHHVLRLYIAGNTLRSAQAIAKLHEICETHLKGRYELEVIDIYQQPDLARDGQVLAAPTLIKLLPPPLRRIIGDLSRVERILVGLDLEPVEKPARKEDSASDA